MNTKHAYLRKNDGWYYKNQKIIIWRFDFIENKPIDSTVFQRGVKIYSQYTDFE